MSTVDPSKTHAPEPLKAPALPRDITLSVAGAFGIIVVVAVAILVRPVPFEDLDGGAKAENRSGANTTRSAASTSEEGEAPTTTAEPAISSASSRELRAKLSREVRLGKLKDAVDAFEALAAADPRSAEDVDVRADMMELATKAEYAGGHEADRVFDTLSTSALGADVLYALVTGKGGSKAATRAGALLKQEEVRKRASAATRIAFDMWAAKSCPEKAALLDRARDEGDGRTLGWLQAMGRGCQMSNDPKLQEATDAIKSRMR